MKSLKIPSVYNEKKFFTEEKPYFYLISLYKTTFYVVIQIFEYYLTKFNYILYVK